jgi:hypothetical protein
LVLVIDITVARVRFDMRHSPVGAAIRSAQSPMHGASGAMLLWL